MYCLTQIYAHLSFLLFPPQCELQSIIWWNKVLLFFRVWLFPECGRMSLFSAFWLHTQLYTHTHSLTLSRRYTRQPTNVMNSCFSVHFVRVSSVYLFISVHVLHTYAQIQSSSILQCWTVQIISKCLASFAANITHEQHTAIRALLFVIYHVASTSDQ